MARILIADPDPTLSHELSLLLERFQDGVLWVPHAGDAAAQLAAGTVDLLIMDERLIDPSRSGVFGGAFARGPVPIVLVSQALPLDRLIGLYKQGISYVVFKPVHPREMLSCVHALLRHQQRIVCLGGGTGLYTLLLGLKRLPGAHLTSIVGMSDDGGSSGRIREAFGVLPPGDVRRSLVALSTAPALMNELIQYRFEGGEGLKDHNLGNLLLTAMANLKGSMAEAVRAMSDILNIQGLVLPVTTSMSTLVARFADGTVVRGEHRIDVPEGRNPALRIEELRLEPSAEANPSALAALLAADLITIGPGDLFTSIVATFVVQGIRDAVCASKARKVYLCNLMTKPGETSGFTVADHIREIVRYLGRDVLETVLVSSGVLPPEAIDLYAKRAQAPVRLDHPEVLRSVTKAAILVRDLGSTTDLVRHDSTKLAFEIARLLEGPSKPSSGPHAKRATPTRSQTDRETPA